MRSKEEKRDKGNEAKHTRAFSVAMVIAIVLSVFVVVVPAFEALQNETGAGGVEE